MVAYKSEIKKYNGARNAREIEKFLWALEAYFGAMGIEDDAQKVSNASLSLKDVALVWWRCRGDGIRRGSNPINTRDEFKKQFKKQFYPEDAENDARDKLRHLQHKEGHVRDYIREFQELLLEIPSMREQDALFYFLDGLCGWAKMELKRRGVQDLASAIAAAETLVEYKRESLKKPNKKTSSGKGGGDRDKSPRRDQPSSPKDKGHVKKDGLPKKYTCFLCNGPHRVFECPKKGKLAALIQGEEEKQEEERNIASLKLLNAIHAKVEGKPRGRMYVEAIINGKPLQAMLDTGADTVYMAKELADEVGLSYTKEKGFVNGVNARSLPIAGIARDAPIQIGQWKGKADITVAPLDDKKFYLGINFLDEVKAFLEPYTDTMCIMETGEPCVVPVKRELSEGQMLSTLQVSKGVRKNEPTFLATLKIGEEPKGVQAPKTVQKVLEEFKDVMPAELPKRLPPRREVDHAIELEPGG